MQQTTLWQILEALPSSALLEIEKMTRSPFFNQRKDVEQLYAGLRKYLKLKKVPVREALCAEIWPETPLDNAAFRLSLHLLQQLVLRYLQIKKLEEDDGQQAIFRARALRGLSLDQLAHETLSRSEKYFMESPRQDPEFQEQKFQYMVELLRTSGGGARTRNLNLQQLSDQLDKSWFLKKMKTAAELLSHQTVYKVEYNYGTLDLLLQHLQAHPNPSADGRFHVQAQGPWSDAVQVFDGCGRLLWQGLGGADFEVDLSGCPAGMYVLLAHGEAGMQALRLVRE